MLETIKFEILPSIELKVVLQEPFARNEDGFDNVESITKIGMAGASHLEVEPFYMGEVYTIAAPSISRTHLTDPSETDVTGITYKLSADVRQGSLHAGRSTRAAPRVVVAGLFLILTCAQY